MNEVTAFMHFMFNRWCLNECRNLFGKELGDDITVIHSRNVKPKGFFAFLKKMQVEITVAKEEEMDRPQNTAKETLAQVFTDIRYTRSDNEALSATLINTLRNQGFL